MLFLLPLLFLIFTSIKARQYHAHWRQSIVCAAVITATILVAITEISSLGHAFSFYPLLLCWLVLLAIAAWMALRSKLLKPLSLNFFSWPLSDKLLLGMIVVIITVTGLTAAIGVPNTWDSMTYHLARVSHWVQDGTVANYPTNITRQLFTNPFPEFVIANLRVLGGGPSSPNAVQWLAMLGSLIGVSLITLQFGGNRRAQLISSSLVACLPMGILEAVSTQTDYVCAWWMVVFVFYLIETHRRFSWGNAIVTGLSLGLALLTKGNSYVFVLPFLIWFFGANLRRLNFQHLAALGGIVLIALSLNFGQYVRTTQCFGSPFWTNTSLTNQSLDLKTLEENVLRNISIHAATPSLEFNGGLQNFFSQTANTLGADINDQHSMMGGNFSIHSLNFDEDYSGNMLHAFVFVIVFILLWFYRELRSKTGIYVVCLLASFLLFCLIVRYQPWNSRFHLPLFVLFCPVVGLFLEYLWGRFSLAVVILFGISAIPWLFLNNQHPWIGPLSIWKQPSEVQYFYKKPNSLLPYVSIAEHIKASGCRQIGLMINENDWEYPWWELLKSKGMRIEHVGVSNASSNLNYPLGLFDPCIIIASGKQDLTQMTIQDVPYAKAGSINAGEDVITIFLRMNA